MKWKLAPEIAFEGRIVRAQRIVSFYGVRAYDTNEGNLMWGTNVLFDLLLQWGVPAALHNAACSVFAAVLPGWRSPPGFPLKVLAELEWSDA